jgi:hypothetical protein
MTDFLSRVAQRALGLRPAIQPLVVSRYAPARLPISEASESEPVSQMSTEGNRRNVEGAANVRSPSLISNPGRQPLTEQRLDDEPLRDHLNPLSEHSQSSGPDLENEIPQPHSLAEFEAATPFEAAPFGAEPPNTTNTSVTTAAAVKTEAPSLLGSNLPKSEQQTESSLQESSGYSAAEESSIDHESLVNVEERGEPLRRVSKGPALPDSTGYSAAEESSIDHESLVNVEELGAPLRRVSKGPALPDSTGYSAAEESSIVDESLVNVEELGEPLRRVSKGLGLPDSTGNSAEKESSIVDESLVSVEKTGEPLRRVARKGPALQVSTGRSAEESSIDHESLVNVEKTGEPLHRVMRNGPALQDSSGQSAGEESSIVEEGTLTVENLEASRRVSSGRLKPPADRVRDGMQAVPGLSQPDNASLNSSHHSRQFPETSDQGERNLQVDEGEDFALEGELRSLSAPERSRRETDSFTEVFARKPVSSVPLLQDERVETGPPVIRVTIGRVEVRAVTPPLPAVEPSPPPAPKLSLDEFLRQHNGRRQ